MWRGIGPFVVGYPVRKAADLEGIAKKVEVLKRHGRVNLIVGMVAERTDADLPPGGSPWHEFTVYLSTWQKLFPHSKMRPFLDMKHVARNHALLKDTLKVARRHGYGAATSFHTPFYMPEEFFAKYPQYRGARCDHPRRSRREAYAMCVDHPDVLAMYREMSAEMAREIPELESMTVMTNDAGAGLCWSDWIYAGPNGPAACRHISTAVRVKKLLEAISQGAGRPIDFLMNGNFSAAEIREMESALGEGFHYELHHGAKDDERSVSVGLVRDNPVKGIFDPVQILQQMDRTKNPSVQRVRMPFGMSYVRGHDLEDAAHRVIEMVDMFFAEPAYGTVERFNLLRKVCGKWVGAKKRDDLLEAFVALNKAYETKNLLTFPPLSNYIGVGLRHINRPLVILPELLTEEEESYFLRHVFNIHRQEGRMDYGDAYGVKFMGGHPQWFSQQNWNPRLQVLDNFRTAVHKVARVLDDMVGTAAGETLKNMGMSLRLYASVLRSVNNCLSMGVVRDRNMAKLAGPTHLPPKIGDWIGDPDLQLMNGYMRDELDNAAEMISLMENGGIAADTGGGEGPGRRHVFARAGLDRAAKEKVRDHAAALAGCGGVPVDAAQVTRMPADEKWASRQYRP